ncbi:MAG: DoxX family rane protein [Verrucomicrobiales bacterium]|nr:DoxX family rane protein [Verrucomicrobiales bacterium]
MTKDGYCLLWMRAAVSIWVLGIFFVVAGANHFINPDFYLAIMPPYLPWHGPLVFISGVAEILGGIGVLVPATRRLAGWGLIALLIAVYPANIHAALHGIPGSHIARGWLIARLPFQFVMLAWVYFSCVKRSKNFDNAKAQRRKGER